MEENMDLKKIEQKTYRYSQQDGMLEIFMGMFFAFYGGYFHHVLSGFTSEFPWLPFFFVFAFSAIVVEWVRKRVTYPRIGRVKFTEAIKPLYFIPAIVTLIAAPFMVYIADILSWNISPYITWLPALFGIVLVGIFQSSIKKTGDTRYYAFVILSVVSGILLSVFEFASLDMSIVIFFLIVGIPLAIFGVGKFLYFIHTVPVVEATEDEKYGFEKN